MRSSGRTMIGVLAFSSFLLAGWRTAQAAGDPAPTTQAVASGLVPVKVFNPAKDLPEPEPGKPAWATGNQWSYGIAFHDKWVYAASTAEYILQFERDPATANMKYLAAFPFEFHETEKGAGVGLSVRRLPDGSPVVCLDYGSHGPGEHVWFAIDKATGKLTLKGKPGNPGVLSPDQQRAYRMVKDDILAWFHIEADGSAVEDGKIKTSESNHHGPMVISPDGRNLYMINYNSLHVDTYEIDAKTGKVAFVASVDAKASLQPTGGGLMPMSPDGRHVYAFSSIADGKENAGETLCVLGRDPAKGTLTILSGGKTDPKFKGQGGSTWVRANRFAFNADGKGGYFLPVDYHHNPTVLGAFTRDPATGALAVVATIPARSVGVCTFVLDPANGNMFTVGPLIASFKTPAAAAGRH